MRTRLIAIAAVISASTALVQCKTRPGNRGASQKFSITDPSDSLLKHIEATSGKMPVCLALIGFDESERKTAELRFKESLSKAANAWNYLLKDYPDWKVKHQLTLNFKTQTSECKDEAPSLNFNVWQKAADFERDYCQVSSTRVCSSGTLAGKRTIYIGPVNRGMPDDIYDYFTILHEYGHLLALGDTYRIPGRSEWEENQPPSVMNGQNLPPEMFTSDDRWGLWAVLYAVKTGTRSCRGYGKEVEMKKNDWQHVLCDPRSEVTYVHRDIPVETLPARPESDAGEATDALLPTPGKWKYDEFDAKDTWLEIEHVPGKQDRFRAIGFVNGTSRSPNGTLYECSDNDPAGSPRRCVVKNTPGFEISVISKTRIRLTTPGYPNGIEVTYLRTAIDWSL
ncbi:MAG: hypothetical protein RIQ81_1072 [Pseudomonadota bacterium]|jgi:hypothetical protein